MLWGVLDNLKSDINGEKQRKKRQIELVLQITIRVR